MKVAVLLSGGVDSSVALRLLQEEGHEVTAYYLKIWLEDEVSHLGECPWEDDLEFARKVCEQAGVELKTINLQKEYWEKVVKHAIDEVKAGRTPNPDMLCNQRIKFAAALEHIKGYDKIASGHYAGVEEKDEKFYLKRVQDPIKDQTYFLSQLSQEQLSKLLFPLAPYTKEEVRELANKYNLPNKDRKDSQGICFLGKIKYNDFLQHYLGEKEGDFVDIDTGKVVGKHKGFWFHTVGQRRGTGLGHGPWYVVKKDTEKNIVYVSNKFKEQEMREFTVHDLNWIPEKPSGDLKVKVRHGEDLYGCEIVDHGDYLHVKLDRDDQGLASGQFAVFFDDQYCYGGGLIRKE